jgi:hypothetical protein
MSDAWVEAKFRVCYLTEQHRQDDEILNQILNAIRAQSIQTEHLQALHQSVLMTLAKPLLVFIRIIWMSTISIINT